MAQETQKQQGIPREPGQNEPRREGEKDVGQKSTEQGRERREERTTGEPQGIE